VNAGNITILNRGEFQGVGISRENLIPAVINHHPYQGSENAWKSEPYRLYRFKYYDELKHNTNPLFELSKIWFELRKRDGIYRQAQNGIGNHNDTSDTPLTDEYPKNADGSVKMNQNVRNQVFQARWRTTVNMLGRRWILSYFQLEYMTIEGVKSYRINMFYSSSKRKIQHGEDSIYDDVKQHHLYTEYDDYETNYHNDFLLKATMEAPRTSFLKKFDWKNNEEIMTPRLHLFNGRNFEIDLLEYNNLDLGLETKDM